MAHILLIVDDWLIHRPIDFIFSGKGVIIQKTLETLKKNGHSISHIGYDDFIDAKPENLKTFSIILLEEKHSQFIQNIIANESPANYQANCLVPDAAEQPANQVKIFPPKNHNFWHKAYFVFYGKDEGKKENFQEIIQATRKRGKFLHYLEENNAWQCIGQLLSPRTKALQEFSEKEAG